jgi:hypothetical protein
MHPDIALELKSYFKGQHAQKKERGQRRMNEGKRELPVK